MHCVLYRFVLNLSAGSLSSSLLLNLVLLTVVDLPGMAVAGWLAQRHGTRQVASGLFLACTGVLAALSVASARMASPAAVMALALLGKGCVSGAFTLMWVLPMELYPTTMRGAGLGFANVCGRLGGMLAPILTSGLPLPVVSALSCAMTAAGAVALHAIGGAPKLVEEAH